MPSTKHYPALLAKAPLLLAGILLLTACKGSTEPALSQWEATLVPEPAGDVSGRVVALSQPARTEISILIEIAEAGATYRWRIHSGTCQSDGDMLGGAAQYPALNPGEGGSAEAQAVISSTLRSGAEYSARVSLAEEGGPEEMVACGNLLQVH
ncbi:hypothetical protein ACFL0I_01250 [Gemmatimonadota bacterium]